MRFLTFLILIFSVIDLNAQISTYFVDPNTGNDSNSGSIDSPYKTISKGVSAIDSTGKLYLRGGNYFMSSKLNLNKNGKSNNYIKIWAYLDEKVVIDCTGNSSDGISISGNYYHLKGMVIKNAGHNGINTSGNNNIIENCVVRENKNTGLHLTGSFNPGPSNNLILHCDAINNFDPPVGGNADGFSAKWIVGPGNVFRGCRAINNSDDGWDLWMGTGTITIDSCISFRNGFDIWHTGQVDGNGNGFKLGGSNVATPHIVKNCLAFDNAGNGGKGFDENNNLAGQTIYNCTSFRNRGPNFSLPSANITGQHIVKNCISFQGSVSLKNCVQEKNSWQGFTVTSADFVSTDTAMIYAPRNPDGSLPKSSFLRLVKTSQLVDAGVDVGIPYNGKAPDLGAFETDGLTEARPPSTDFKYSLEQNYPNPFNPSTTISFQIPVNNFVSLKIYDLMGREAAILVSGTKQLGRHHVIWNANNFPGGVYFYQIISGDYKEIKKLILMK